MTTLENKIKDASCTKVAMETKINGLKLLYEAALLSGDTNADSYRATIHDCMDILLDAMNSQIHITKQILRGEK